MKVRSLIKYMAGYFLPVLIFFILAGTGLDFLSADRSGKPIDTNAKKIDIRGIYGSPDPFWKKNHALHELNVNSIFLSGKSINNNLTERARKEGLKIFAEFPVLNGKDYVDKHPGAWAIDRDGHKVKPASWFMGVCPTEPGFRQYRLTELRELLRSCDLDGVWLDYLHWHAQFEEPEPILPETCFCGNCISTFSAWSGIKIPGGNIPQQADRILTSYDSLWREWRCSVIAGWVTDIRMILNNEKPGALLGIYHCPWNDTDFNAARRRILGLDYDMLREIVDVFSPMVYHGRMGREPLWVKENIAWFCDRIRVADGKYPKVWPIVQAYDDPTPISAGEFGDVLRHGASSGASGVMMFTSYSVAESEEKTKTMKEVFAGWKD